MRRRARIEARLERLSVADTLRAVRFAETVVLVLDAVAAARAPGSDDRRIWSPRRGGRSCWRSTNGTWSRDRAAALKRLRERLETSLPQLHGVALVPVSGLTGFGLDALMKAVFAADAVWNRRVPTGGAEPLAGGDPGAPPAAAGRRPPPAAALYDAGQYAGRRAFALFASKPGELPEAIGAT